MKKNIIIAVVLVLAVVGVTAIIKFSNVSVENQSSGSTLDYNANVEMRYIDMEKDNAAAATSAAEIKLTGANFKTEVEESKGVMMVDMYSPTCPHCVRMGPVVTQIADENQGKYRIGKVNVYAYRNIATKYNIDSVPAFVFFKDGKEVSRLVGEKSKQELLDKLAEVAK